MKTYLIEVCAKGDEINIATEDVSWIEDVNCESEAKVKAIISNFNKTLRPGERARVLLGITEMGDSATTPHQWYKSYPVTISDSEGVYDRYRCKKCGITGKRFGLSDVITTDKKYQKSKYRYCTN